jgi:Ca-activated chloride channel family protein
MTHRIASLVLAVAAAVAPGLSRVQPRAETIDVSVKTEAGSTVAALTASDFDIRVDGEPAVIQKVTAPPAPLTLVMLFDVTASMTTYGSVVEELERVIVPSLAAGDRVRVGTIANRPSLAPRFSSVPREIIADGRKTVDVRRQQRYGPSPIWDALKTAAEALASEPGRRAIVLVTDGRATGNTISAADAANAVVRAGAVVEVLTETRTSFYRQGSEDSYVRVRTGFVLEELARVSGGMILPEDPNPTVNLPQAAEAIARLVNDAREMYTIEFAPPGSAGAAHRKEISVSVKRSGLTVRARTAFRAP